MKTAAALSIFCFIFLPHLVLAQRPGQSEKLRLVEREQRRDAALINALATPPQANDIDVTYYSLDLTIVAPPQGQNIEGSVLTKAISRSDTLRHVPLDLSDPMTVDSVVMNGAKVNFSHAFSLLLITLDRVYPAGGTLVFTVYYHGMPVPNGYGSFVFSSHGTLSTPWIWSLSEPYGARDWWPCKDHPTDKADSVDIRVTCDSDFKVGSNGRLVGVTEHNNHTHTYFWSERYPIATYLVSVAMSDYTEFSDWFHYGPSDSMQVLNYVLPEQYSDARPKAAKTVKMLEIYSRLFGLYPFIKEKYGHSSFGWGGAMEHQTMTSTTTYEEFVIAHELTHQWFGDMITCGSWRDLWLNEGFATYGEALYAEVQYGVAFFHDYMRPIMDAAERAVGTLRVSDTTSISNLFAPTRVYDKGGSVLHMLRHVLGDSVFFASLRAYAADPHLRYATALTEDFQRVCERVSGRDLAFFFNEWVNGEGFPSYEYSWSVKPTGGAIATTIHLSQGTKTTPPAFFTMPLDCRLSKGTWDTTVVLQNTDPIQDFTLLLSHRPDTVRFDPGEWVLANFSDLSEGIPTSFALLQNYPNPFNPTTTIPFDIAHQEYVSLKVYDILGREVATLVEGKLPPGHHAVVWDRTSVPSKGQASGVYIYRLVAGGFSESRTMLLIK